MKDIESRYVIGIDPGLAFLGWGVLRIDSPRTNKIADAGLHTGSKVFHVAHGVIETKSKESLGHRLLEIEQAIDHVFKRYNICIMAYEAQFFVKNITSGLQVAHALGVILLYGAKQGVEVHSFSPKEIKLQVTGSAGAKKETVQKFVSMQLGLDEVKIHHSADALGAALSYYYKGIKRYKEGL